MHGRAWLWSGARLWRRGHGGGWVLSAAVLGGGAGPRGGVRSRGGPDPGRRPGLWTVRGQGWNLCGDADLVGGPGSVPGMRGGPWRESRLGYGGSGGADPLEVSRRFR
ncbi:hypothetical protein Misp01_31190 [Microtetraspora sp. NBRC 13810]|nr:hypothetical protein Misp01_31190 [Microtetraspora sp. NBRC 13810]